MDAIVHRPDNAKPHVDVDIFACGLLGLPPQSLSCFSNVYIFGFLHSRMEHGAFRCGFRDGSQAWLSDDSAFSISGEDRMWWH